MWRQYNPNPNGLNTDDCTARALTLALDVDWETAFFLLALMGAQMGIMQLDLNAVWWAVLRQHGYYRKSLPDNCPDCYSVREFCAEHPKGVYVLYTDKHVLTAIDGDWYDTADSGNEVVIYYWYRKDG